MQNPTPFFILLLCCFCSSSVWAIDSPVLDGSELHRDRNELRKSTGITLSVLESYIRRSIISTRTPYGFKIKKVEKGSAAEEAGLRRGDLLMKVGGKPIVRVSHLLESLRTLKPGATVEVLIARRKRPVVPFSRTPWKELELELGVR